MNNDEYLTDDDDGEPTTKAVVKILDAYIKSDNIADLLDDDDKKEVIDYCLKSYEEDLLSMKEWLADADEILEFMETTGKTKNYPFKKAANIKLPLITTAVLQLAARMQSEMTKNGKVVNYKIIGGDVKIGPPQPVQQQQMPQQDPNQQQQDPNQQQQDPNQQQQDSNQQPQQQGPQDPNQQPQQQMPQQPQQPPQPTLIYGLKERKGKRVCKHLNWQIIEKLPNYQSNRDQLVTMFGAIGHVFTKTFYEPAEGVIRSDLIPYDQLIINNAVQSLESAETVTHKLYKTTRELVECQRAGYYSELEDDSGNEIMVKNLVKDRMDSKAVSHAILEQHCYLDLDNDGLPEPYIVTIHYAEKKLLRIKARFKGKDVEFNESGKVKKIKPRLFFNDFICTHSPDGGYWGRGLGHLLLNLNDAANTMINILTNAGNLATMQGGFLSKNLRIKKGLHEIEPGEWVTAESTDQALKDGIVPFNYKEPSAVLFQVLGLMLEQAKSVSATSDMLSGQTSDSLANVSPGVVSSIMSQGLQVFQAATKRYFRGAKKEVQKIVEINAEHIDPNEYIALVNPHPNELAEMFDPRTGELIDYNLSELELQIVPVVDVNEATAGEKLLKTQAKMTMAMQLKHSGENVNLKPLFKEFLEAYETENIDEIIPAQEPPPAPDPKMLKVQQDAQMHQDRMQIESGKLQTQQQKLQIDTQMKQAELQLRSKEVDVQMKNIMSQQQASAQKARTAEDKVQLDVYKTKMDQDHNTEVAALDLTLKQRELDIKDKKVSIDANNSNNSDKTLT